MAETIQFNLSGDRELLASLRRLNQATEAKVTRKAVGEAVKPIAEAARQNLIRNGTRVTGALAKSMGIVKRSYRNGEIIVAVFGPRRGFQTTYRGKKHDPANIGHLVEYGHQPGGWHAKQASARTVEAKPFMRPAIDAHKGEALDILAVVLRAQIQRVQRGG